MKKRFPPLIVLVLLLALLSSCSTVSDNSAVVLMYDKSASTAPNQSKISTEVNNNMRADYLSASRKIISVSGPGTTIYGGLINDRSLEVMTLPINTQFPDFRPLWDNELIFKGDLLKKKQNVLQQIERAVNEAADSNSTCIIDSTLLVQQIFKSTKTANEVLVMFSDMVEDCDSIDFDETPRPKTTGLPRNETEVNNLLAELQRLQKVPDLKGVRVCVYRAVAQSEANRSSRFILLQNFWTAFFRTAGAEVEHYGTFISYRFESKSRANVALPDEKVIATQPVKAQ